MSAWGLILPIIAVASMIWIAITMLGDRLGKKLCNYLDRENQDGQ